MKLQYISGSMTTLPLNNLILTLILPYICLLAHKKRYVLKTIAPNTTNQFGNYKITNKYIVRVLSQFYNSDLRHRLIKANLQPQDGDTWKPAIFPKIYTLATYGLHKNSFKKM